MAKGKYLRPGTYMITTKVTQAELKRIKEWNEHFGSGGVENAIREMATRGYQAAEERGE